MILRKGVNDTQTRPIGTTVYPPTLIVRTYVNEEGEEVSCVESLDDIPFEDANVGDYTLDALFKAGINPRSVNFNSTVSNVDLDDALNEINNLKVE